MTPGDAKRLYAYIMSMDWSRVSKHGSVQEFSGLIAALCRDAYPTLATAAPAVAFKYPTPMVTLTPDEARGLLEHMQLWRDGETLLSQKLHGQAQGYCLALRVLCDDAEAEFKRGLRLVKVSE